MPLLIVGAVLTIATLAAAAWALSRLDAVLEELGGWGKVAVLAGLAVVLLGAVGAIVRAWMMPMQRSRR